MAAFPRATGALPRLATPLRGPRGMQDWGLTGKAQVRDISPAGRTWTEVYPVLNANTAEVRALVAAINRGFNTGEIWQITHIYDPNSVGQLNAVIVGVAMPDMDTTGYIDAGLAVTWREQV